MQSQGEHSSGDYSAGHDWIVKKAKRQLQKIQCTCIDTSMHMIQKGKAVPFRMPAIPQSQQEDPEIAFKKKHVPRPLCFEHLIYSSYFTHLNLLYDRNKPGKGHSCPQNRDLKTEAQMNYVTLLTSYGNTGGQQDCD